MNGKACDRNGRKRQPGPEGKSPGHGGANLKVARKRCFATTPLDLDNKFGRPRGLHRDDGGIEKPVIRMSADGRNSLRVRFHGAARRDPLGRGGRASRPRDLYIGIQKGCLALLNEHADVHGSRAQRRWRGEDRQFETVYGLPGKDRAAIAMAANRSQQAQCEKDREGFRRLSSRSPHQSTNIQIEIEHCSKDRQAASASSFHAFPSAER